MMERNTSKICDHIFQQLTKNFLFQGTSGKAFRSALSFIRLIPSFLVIGGMKCGTTSLHEYLSQHPQVLPPMTKEVHFFNRNYHKGLNCYRSHFPTKLKKEFLERLFSEQRLTFESTPDYLFHPLVPARISRHFPDMKLIILLRNPVDRAWSHYHHEVRMDNEHLSFQEAIRQEDNRLRGEKERIIQKKYYFSHQFHSHSYRSRGVYVRSVKRYLQYFERAQILIVESEQFFTNPASVFSEVTSFLGLSSFSPASFDVYNAGGDYGNMPAGLKKELSEFYHPYNRELENLTEKEFRW